jgi:LmbE family N-acetylglucosaminyl deacetylase
MNIDLPAPASALVVVAHPDDAEFQCGATLAKWANSGTEVSYLICTDGSKGTWNPNCDQNQLIQDREIEQRNAAQSLGATGQIVFLGHTDGELSSDLETRSQVAFVIRNIQPNVILGHDPWKRYRLHPDHRHAGLLAVEGIVGARDPFFFREHGLAPHRPDALLLFEADEPDHAENVHGWHKAKVDALLQHKSQFETTHKINGDDDASAIAKFSASIASDLKRNGSMCDLEAAELFKLITAL